ncbi:MAG: hypothetical protein V4654_00470 [Bdellovibrionota bacterium]
MKIFFTILVMSLPAFAHEFKTKDFCSVKTKDMCAHIGYDKKPDAKQPFEFTFDIINKVKAKDVTDVVINVVTKDKQTIPTKWTIRSDGHHWDAKANSAASQVEAIQAKYKYKGSEEEILVELK